MKKFIALFLLIIPTSNYSQNNSVHLLQKIGDDKSLSSVLTNMVQIYEKTGAYDSPAYAHRKLISLSQLPGFETKLSDSYGHPGFVYNSIECYSKTLENSSEALKTSSALGDSISMATDMNNIAAIYLHWKNYKMTEQYFRSALALYKRNRNLASTETTMANLANVLQQEKKYNSAHLLYKKSFIIAYGKGSERSAAARLNNNGMLLHQSDKSDSEIIYLRNSLETGRGLVSSYSVCSSLQKLGDVYLDIGDLESAQKYLLEAIDCAESLKALPVLEKTYRSLGFLYEKTGQTDLALGALKKYQSIKDSLFSIKSQVMLSELEAKHKNEIQHKKVELLVQKNKLFETRLNRNRIVLFGLIGVVALTLLATVAIAVLYIQKQWSYKMLVSKNLEITLHKESADKISIPGVQTHINDEEKNRLLIEINRLVKEERIFARKQLSLTDMAKLLNTNTTYLSRLINDHYKTNFPNFINKFRVREAQIMLAQEKFRNHTFEAIADAVGFHSRSAFNVAFKNITGVTPGNFIKNLEPANFLKEHGYSKSIFSNDIEQEK
ncbi:MAG: AraC family transcriptional regulator [Lentimicrobium sp.]|uniref:AraC family transcriptional regulator n=1 Tax=Lentimicrobium sp. TaxID=2034841 RepID=UPI0025F97965|nr:AraC family transcriptional regulator [Lentimicrobium sp.]MCO5258125.1 AraC family transcriptional regulator [Lentimicrobium sp.]